MPTQHANKGGTNSETATTIAPPKVGLQYPAHPRRQQITSVAATKMPKGGSLSITSHSGNIYGSKSSSTDSATQTRRMNPANSVMNLRRNSRVRSSSTSPSSEIIPGVKRI